jgi:uncharacterized repeat protein (TIGR01451 family)
MKNLTATLVAGLGILFVLALASPAHAVNFTATGNPDDTLAGTVITAFSTSETLNYTDINDNPKPQVNPAGDLQVTVLPVYGLTGGGNRAIGIPNMDIKYGYVSQARYYYMSVTNEGNASDSYTLTAEANFASAGSGTWTVEYWRDNAPYGTAEGSDVLIGTLTSGSPSTSEIVSVAEDAAYYTYFKVVYPAAAASNNDQVTTTLSGKTWSTPVGQYTGANGLTYGGAAEYTTSAQAWAVAKPIMVINGRASKVDAPKAPFGGGATNPVPGSIISYRTTYTNTGLISAEGVIFADKVPSYTNLAHFNKTGDTANVTLTTDITKRSGDWTIWYSTQADPQRTYGNSTGWTMVGTLDATASNSFPAGAVTYNLATSDPQASATWIKWEKTVIPSTEADKTITWGVTIR